LKFNFSVAKAPFPVTSTALAGLLLIALFALVWAIIERRQIVRKNKEIAAARFDLANEAERERRRIARDLHDQTLADLRKLMLKSDKLPSETTEFRQEIESVSDEIRRICEDLSPSVLENVGLTAALEFLLSSTIENHKFLCLDGLEERLNFSANVQMQIYRIAQEVLNNIKRHAEANFVEMRISDNEKFKLTIENNGKTFSPDFENLPKGRGISNIKSRAELIEAEILWHNNEDGKTIFTLQKIT
jgi:signal transduction histidine kinase